MDLAARPYRIPDTMPPPDRVRALEAWVTAGLADPLLRAVAATLRDRALGSPAARPPLTPEQQAAVAQTVLDFVQDDVGYVPDPEGGDYHQGPLYTLAFGGDCEDLAVLVAILLRLGAVPASVEWIDVAGAPLNHVTTLAEIGPSGAIFADGSVRGARLGENPWHAARRTAQTDRFGVQ